jgi:putative ABC transport system ATP-binding protein
MTGHAATSADKPGGVRIRCVNVGQVYRLDGENVVALEGVDIDVPAGQSTALFGPSGSGKSTLLAIVAGLRQATTGNVWVGANDLSAMSEAEILRLRGRDIGIVLQNPSRSLLPYGTALDNIRFARRAVQRRDRSGLLPALDLLDRLGLAHIARLPAASLSGGEQQRLSVAVAMARAPRLLLADEPTSQLDSANRDNVTAMLTMANVQFGTTLIVVTHDPGVADAMQQRITLSGGLVTTA